MNIQEKIQFVLQQSDSRLDAFFQLRPITDVNHEGTEDLYLQGLTSEALYTSYKDVLGLMEWLKGQGVNRFCDLGCGVGRTVLLWSWLFPDAQGIGVELVPERLNEARSAGLAKGLQNVNWVEGDFSSPSVELPKADVYFIYLSTGPALDALIDKIKKQSNNAWIAVIESHGDLKPRLQWESWWLVPHSQRFTLTSQRHDPWLALYKVNSTHPGFGLERSWDGRAGLMPSELELHPNPLSYVLSKSFQRHWELVIGENNEQWTMETLGVRWHGPLEIEGQFPPRQFKWIKGNIGLRHIPEQGEYGQWVKWRREGTFLSYISLQGEKAQNVLLRKIYVAPVTRLEFSNGRQITPSELQFLRPSN